MLFNTTPVKAESLEDLWENLSLKPANTPQVCWKVCLVKIRQKIPHLFMWEKEALRDVMMWSTDSKNPKTITSVNKPNCVVSLTGHTTLRAYRSVPMRSSSLQGPSQDPLESGTWKLPKFFVHYLVTKQTSAALISILVEVLWHLALWIQPLSSGM